MMPLAGLFGIVRDQSPIASSADASAGSMSDVVRGVMRFKAVRIRCWATCNVLWRTSRVAFVRHDRLWPIKAAHFASSIAKTANAIRSPSRRP